MDQLRPVQLPRVRGLGEAAYNRDQQDALLDGASERRRASKGDAVAKRSLATVNGGLHEVLHPLPAVGFNHADGR